MGTAVRADVIGNATSEDSANRLAWMALTLTPQMGPTRTLRAMSKVDAPAEVLSLGLTELEALGLPAASARFVFEGKARAAAEAEIRRVEEQGAGFLTHDCPDYPERLREIYDPPPVLWTRGETALLGLPGIAVVGTRHPSPYGAGMAQMLSRDLANRGMVIQSGMARGVDTEAHKGAIEAKGKTVAVWGRASMSFIPKKIRDLPSK